MCVRNCACTYAVRIVVIIYFCMSMGMHICIECVIMKISCKYPLSDICLSGCLSGRLSVFLVVCLSFWSSVCLYVCLYYQKLQKTIDHYPPSSYPSRYLGRGEWVIRSGAHLTLCYYISGIAHCNGCWEMRLCRLIRLNNSQQTSNQAGGAIEFKFCSTKVSANYLQYLHTVLRTCKSQSRDRRVRPEIE